MLKNNGKAVASAGSAACLCLLLLLLLVALQHHRVQVEQESDGEEERTRAVAEEEGEGARAGKGFSAYFTKLTRGRREVESPARSSAAEPPPAEDIGADDVFIAVKTTKKFHQSRLNLLLDTWISRNTQQVRERRRSVFAFTAQASPRPTLRRHAGDADTREAEGRCHCLCVRS